MKIWQLTDVHIDYLYSETGDPRNWCHEDSDESTYAGKFGNYLCDGTIPVLNSAVETMRVAERDPDIILWTGDTGPHFKKPTEAEWNYIFSAEKSITSKLKENFPDTLILPTMGNHDSFPSASFPEGYK